MRSRLQAITAGRHFRPKLPARGACDDDIDNDPIQGWEAGLVWVFSAAYGIVAVFLYALSRYPALAPALTGAREVMAATPAE
jgi:hypothetical protein